jgi:hypothetical protein
MLGTRLRNVDCVVVFVGLKKTSSRAARNYIPRAKMEECDYSTLKKRIPHQKGPFSCLEEKRVANTNESNPTNPFINEPLRPYTEVGDIEAHQNNSQALGLRMVKGGIWLESVK